MVQTIHEDGDPKQEITSLRLVQLAGLIGRYKEIEAVSALMQRSDVRLVTITGPGGVGKTCLALQVATLVADSFPDGAYFISLAALKDPTLVIPTLTQEIGSVEGGDKPLFTRLTTFLRNKRLLLLLDNFEQVTAAGPVLSDLLLACPHLKVLVTSRDVLRLRIEQEFVVPPLALPNLEKVQDITQLTHSPAVELFVQRATAVKPDFQVTAANVRDIAEICLHLDGLPLAIELAAARIKLLSPRALLARLDHRLQLLTTGARDLPKRQQTLRNTLTWSYDLLNTEEQMIFRLLSVFSRSCALEAAEHICSMLHPATDNVLEIFTSLIDKNLLQCVEHPGKETHIRLLETVHEYAQECLMQRGEAQTAFHAHALYYLALAEQAEPEMRKALQATWLDRLELECENLRAALNWFMEHQDSERVLHLCGALCHFWLIRGYQDEGYQWIEKALAECKHADISAVTRAKALFVAGVLSYHQGHHQTSIDFLRKSLLVYQEIGDQRSVAIILNKLGRAYARNSPSEAQIFYKKSLALAQEQHDVLCAIDAWISLADEAFVFDDFAVARMYFEEALTHSRALGDRRNTAYCLGGLGQITLREGNYAKAQSLLQQSLEIYREIGDRMSTAFALIPLGMTILYQGDAQTAQILLDESSVVSQDFGNRKKIANYFGTLGEVALLSQKEEPLSAHTLLEDCLSVFKETGNEESIAFKLFALGCMEYVQGTFSVALQLLEESLTFFTQLENRVMTAASLTMIGHVYGHQGEYKQSWVAMEQSLLIRREIGDRWNLAYALSHLGLVALNEGDHTKARLCMEQSLGIAREIGDLRHIAEALSVMGLLRMNEGDYLTAQQLLEESLALSEKVQDRSFIAFRLADLGLLFFLKGDAAQARPLVEKSLALSMQVGHRWFIASCLERLGEIVVAQGQPIWAIQLWGAAVAVRDAIEAPIPPIERPPYEDALATAQSQVGEELFTTTWKAGYLMTPEQVIALQPSTETVCQGRYPQPALETTGTLSCQQEQTEELSALLTFREIEVLRLVATGLTNAQIADQLVISPRTVQAHVRSIYSKLEVSSRSAATRYALEHRFI